LFLLHAAKLLFQKKKKASLGPSSLLTLKCYIISRTMTSVFINLVFLLLFDCSLWVSTGIKLDRDAVFPFIQMEKFISHIFKRLFSEYNSCIFYQYYHPLFYVYLEYNIFCTYSHNLTSKCINRPFNYGTMYTLEIIKINYKIPIS
jgi:hypothetical protein